MNSNPTLLHHILHAKPELLEIFELLQEGTLLIADQVRTAGLANILGGTGQTNTFGEEMQKLDDVAHNVLTETLLESQQVAAVVSEERAEPIYADHDNGNYVIFIDPLDGSSNIDTNCPIGTIFSIYDYSKGLLQKGRKQIAAGYVMYGSSVMLVYSIGKGVHGFTLDPAENEFFLTHPTIQLAEYGDTYSLNEGYTQMFAPHIQKYLTHLKKERKSRARFVGSLIADAHRTFIKGGIFLYPVYDKQPEGKLRLMLEVNPFAYLTEQAGGIALADGKQNPLDIVPDHIHQRSPFIMGSKTNVEVYEGFLTTTD